MNDNKNLILTIVLSMAILIGWNFFYVAPQAEAMKKQQAEIAKNVATTTAPVIAGVTTPVTPAQLATPTQTREQALQGNRIEIDTPALKGSINLVGAKFDDISLKNYRETIDIKSQTITYLSPANAANAYFGEFGFLPANTQAKLPIDTTVWTVSGNTKLTPSTPVILTYDAGEGISIMRTIAIDNQYMVTVKDAVKNASSNPIALRETARLTRVGTPKTEGFYVLHEGMIGVLGEKGLQEIQYDDIAKKKEQTQSSKGGWLGMTDKYWAAVLIPDQNTTITSSFVANTVSATSKIYRTEYAGEPRTIAPNSTLEITQQLFVGAKEVKTIQKYAEGMKDARFDLMIDWGWFHFITKPLFWLIDYLNSITHNFGWAIIIVTLLIKALFFPLAQKSYASIVKMKKVQPEMEELRVKYKDDRQKQQQELMALYKKESINPMAGCWPVLLQIPVFFALYKVLFVTIEMRHAPFFGWIKDLSAPDPTTIFNLFGLLPFDPSQIPFFGQFLMLGIFPILMGITMWVQMQMNPAPNDPVQATVFRWMPVMFTFMLASFPAGLVIYWTWSNFLSIVQQWAIMRKFGVKVELMTNLKAMFGK